MLLRARPDSVKSRKISTEPEKCREQSEIFALSTAIFAVRKCADRSDQERRKHFFEKFFSNDIFILSRRKFYIFALRKMGENKHMMIKSRLRL